MRLLPCVSTPRRSADRRHLEIISACGGGVLFAMRICLMKVWRAGGLMLWVWWGSLGWSDILDLDWVGLMWDFVVLEAGLGVGCPAEILL